MLRNVFVSAAAVCIVVPGVVTWAWFGRPTPTPELAYLSVTKKVNDPVRRHPVDRLTAIEHLMASPPSAERDAECLRRLLALGISTPSQLLDFAETRLEGDLRAQAITALLTQWARTNPGAALRRALSDTSKASEVGAVMAEVGRNSPPTARALLNQLYSRDPEAARVAFPAVLQGMADSRAFEDARLLVDESANVPADTRELSIEMLADQWGRSRPEDAAAWILSIQDEGSRNKALIALGTAWSAGDPESAAMFALQIPPGQTREAMLGQAVNRWASIDAQGAAEWLLQFPSLPDFDEAVARLATQPTTLADHADLALDWAGNIFDPVLRLKTLNTVLSNEYDRDPPTALTRLQEVKLLSEADRQVLSVQLQSRH